MKTTLTPLDPADFIGPAPVTEPDPSTRADAPAGDDAGSAIAENADVSNGEDNPSDSEVASERFIGPRVKLTVEVDAETFDTDIEAAFRKLAREVRIPGFRPGRAPRRVLESHFGSEIGRAQALEEAVPRYYAEAVRDNHVDVVNQPELELTLDGSDGPVAFEATVEVRPVVSVSGYEGLRIEIPSPVPTDEEIDARIDETRRQFADIAEVDRAAAQGDRVTIDIEGSVEGEPLPGLAAQDYLYEVGSGGIVPEVDEHLTGCEAGADLSFSAPHPVQPEMEIDFEITVNTVSELVLPELTDDWVDENTEHDSVAELRDATARQLSFGRIMQANMVLRDEAQKQIAELVEGPVPDAMVSGAIADRMQELGSGLQQRNMTIEEWLEATGQEPASFIGELRDDAERGVRLDLALRAVATAEALEADDDDIDGELERMAATDGRSAAQLREVIAETDGLAHLTSAICKSKALQWAIEAATLIGPDGDTIERSALELPTADDVGGADDTDDDLDGTDSDDKGDTP
ncbi:trigger factor [Candidatus Poriferisodalis sp.]|uniref:trigger factor n=1 Tax=Candidatus Poriferisodalis sp. TaxID=3101277 RepID=UPI003B028C0C